MRFTLKNLRFLQYIDYQNVRKTEFLGCQSQDPPFSGQSVLGFAIELTLIMKIQSHRKTVTNNAVIYNSFRRGLFSYPKHRVFPMTQIASPVAK